MDIDRFGIGSLGGAGADPVIEELLGPIVGARYGCAAAYLLAAGSCTVSSWRLLTPLGLRSTSGIRAMGDGIGGAK